MSTVTETLLRVDEFESIPNPPGAHYELRTIMALHHGVRTPVIYPALNIRVYNDVSSGFLERLTGDSWDVLVECPFRPFRA